ncbi:MAG: threonine synthase [Chloroflexales bacterium]|nr:threonine synthase [Chloroflexales bacterium]
MYHYNWTCSRCGEGYAPDVARYSCPSCGETACLDMRPDYERIAARWTKAELAADPRQSIWRYGPLLPLQPATCAPRSPLTSGQAALSAVGWTPLYDAGRLGRSLGLDQLLIKDDGRNPTGSFKDRASAVVLARALEMGESTVATASSGNAAAALAGLGAAVGLPCIIFVPQSAPEAKVAQLLIYGATVLLVEGSYDDAVDLCLAACDEWDWYNRSTGYNPHTAEGKKTCALEICEQLGWEAPDSVLVSVGDGNIITGLHRGFQDALALGWISHMPRLIGVQAAAAPALYNAWRDGADDVAPDRAETLADSINVGLPRDGFRALRALRETGGICLTVEDEAILHAMSRVARTSGLFTEPAGAATFAGLFALAESGIIGADERVVVVNTGNGLKDIRAAGRAVGAALSVAPTLDAVRIALELD